MSDMLNKLLGRPTPEEMVKKWRQNIRSQERQLERQIRSIEVEEAKVKKTLKTAATKKNDLVVCKTLAKELLRSRKAKDRLYSSKAQLNSVSMQLSQQMATMKVAGSLQKSTDIMKMVNTLVKLPEISKVMMEMQQEMMKAGIIEEMIEDTLEGLDEPDLEEEAEEEVEKVLFEITDGLLGQAGTVGKELETQPAEEVEENQPQLEEMQKRLQLLRG
ncbi:Snf7-domain-containing protein [Paraphysoderma sedebokerense]|nr:Snf7-domain-containing protein [Paraphysoderma sedebokerense]